MLRICKHHIGGTPFDHVPKVHDQDLVAKSADHLHIVTDKENRKPEFIAQVIQQVQNLSLHRHVQGAGDFVAQKNLGLDH